jgi:hypothetical protein
MMKVGKKILSVMMTVQTRVAMMFKCESGADDVSSHDGDSDRDPSYYIFPDFYRLDISCSKDSLDHEQGAIDTTQIGPIDMEISSTIDDLGSVECNVPVLQPELVEGNSPSIRLLLPYLILTWFTIGTTRAVFSTQNSVTFTNTASYFSTCSGFQFAHTL